MRKIIYIAVFAVIFSGFTFFLFFLKVRVSCRSQYGPCPEEILGPISKYNLKGFVKAKSGIVKVLKKSFLVSDFSFQFKLPDILLVNLLTKKPLYALADKNSGETALIDKDGEVLAINKDSTLPKVIISKDFLTDFPSPGTKVAETTLLSLRLISGVFEMYQVGTGEISDGSLVVDIDSHIRVIFPLEAEDPRMLLGSLRLIYPKVSGGELSGKFSQIDLRFKNPVLR